MWEESDTGKVDRCFVTEVQRGPGCVARQKSTLFTSDYLRAEYSLPISVLDHLCPELKLNPYVGFRELPLPPPAAADATSLSLPPKTRLGSC